jgi:hypothetical protein
LPSLHFPYAAQLNSELKLYAHRALLHSDTLEARFAMADLVYVILGLLFFALMGAYANACNRL